MTETLITTNTTVRVATDLDKPDVLEMAHHFLADTAYGTLLTIAPEAIDSLLDKLIGEDVGCVLLAEQEHEFVGMLAIALHPNLFTGELMGSELVWWVEPDARSGGTGETLLRAAEAWVAERGGKALQIAAWRPVLERWYIRLGYQKFETIYLRRLGEQEPEK